VSWNQTNFQFDWVNEVRVNTGFFIRGCTLCLARPEPNKINWIQTNLRGSPGKNFFIMMGLVRLRNEHSVSVPTSRNQPPITDFKNFSLKIDKT